MRIGVTLPQFGGQAADGAEEVAAFARAAEERGADGLWVGDRLLAPVEPTVGYGGGPGFPPQFRRQLDPLTLLGAAAAATSRARLGTNVLNAPWYPPPLLARTALTLDRISGGRFLLGLGTGWSPEEFDAVGVPMAERGIRLDECLKVLRAWWDDDPVTHDGPVSRIAPAHVDLKPHGVPVYLAGVAPRARRRVVEHADGWLPVAVPGRTDLRTAVLEPWAGLRERAGRELGAVLRVNPLPGTPVREVTDLLAEAADAGIEEAFVELMYLADSADAALDLVEGLVG
ncbi:MAG TPA: TIGR03619 family F420-dependent LLM class oxidoreductase [Pseudonocardia sp.]|jgi:probable F420-dependent oxidoreductase|nr:TIGR03619 family F420-dependent LLM class oxidoreductase [Pseudonocardia sp.]